MTTEQPPGYAQQQARFGERCRDCAFYESHGSGCKKYGIEVINYYYCRDWKRNPDLPIEVV